MICSLPSFTTQEPHLTNVSYTVIFGDAPGPNGTRAQLTLESRPDPVFPEDGTALSQTEFFPGSGAPLTISVSLTQQDYTDLGGRGPGAVAF